MNTTSVNGRFETAWTSSGCRTTMIAEPKFATQLLCELIGRHAPRDEFAPCKPENAPTLQRLQKSTLCGWVGRSDACSASNLWDTLADKLSRSAIDVSSAVLGGPTGCVLHVAYSDGAFTADFRRRGATAPDVVLSPTPKPRPDNVSARLFLDDGIMLTLPPNSRQSKDFASFVLNDGSRLNISQAGGPRLEIKVIRGDLYTNLRWKENGEAHDVCISQYGENSSSSLRLEDKGAKLHMSHYFGDEPCEANVQADLSRGPHSTRNIVNAVEAPADDVKRLMQMSDTLMHAFENTYPAV